MVNQRKGDYPYCSDNETLKVYYCIFSTVLQDDDDGGIGSGGATIVLAVQPFVPRDIVGIEETTLAALQVQKPHCTQIDQ